MVVRFGIPPTDSRPALTQLAVASSYDGRTAEVPPDELELRPPVELPAAVPVVPLPVPDEEELEVEVDVELAVVVEAAVVLEVVELPPLDPLEVVVRLAEVLQAESKQAPRPIQRDRVIGGFLAATRLRFAFSKADRSVVVQVG
jgi:hypothetical protein